MVVFIIICIAVLVAAAVAVAVIVAKSSDRSGERFGKTRGYMPKGKAGEFVVAEILGETVAGEQYVINDYLFADRSGKSRQIDHIYINRYGIWVIETKNYAGEIYGREDRREWTQVLANGREVNRFYNPLKQNLTHIYSLAEVIGRRDVFHNVVCFVGNADISGVAANNVYSLHGLAGLKTRETSVRLTAEEMEKYYCCLVEWRNAHPSSEAEHIAEILEKRDEIRRGICPRCGGRLVVRSGKYGPFFGCSNYPECKFRKKIDEDV